ncbi:MAG: DUF6572 domain-containing protein [Rhodoferax sp.]
MTPGIENPAMLDLVTSSKDEVILIMVATEPWGDEKVLALQSKTQAYLEYLDSGCLLKDYPQSRDMKVRLQLDSTYPISPMAKQFIEVATAQWLRPLGIPFSVVEKQDDI